MDFIKKLNKELNKIEYLTQHTTKCLLEKLSDEKGKLKRKIIHKNTKIKSYYIIDLFHKMLTKSISKNVNQMELYSELLKKNYSTTYPLIIDWLKENGYIRMTSNYLVGKKSRTYTIFSHKWETIQIRNYDNICLKKYKSNVINITSRRKTGDIIDQDIKQKLLMDLYKIDINLDDANSILSNIKNDKSYNKNLLAIDSIRRKQIHCTFDNYGRMHTNFTILKSNIRKDCLYIDGESVSELDISNSQPLFLTKIILENTNILDITRKKDFIIFKRLIIMGKFYEYFMNRTNISKKSIAKESIYTVFFGKNTLRGKTRIHNINFKKTFPSVFEFIKQYKLSKKEIFGDMYHKVLSFELQKSESEMVFNNIIREIMEKYPNEVLFTVHDSISFRQKNMKKFKVVFDKHIRNILN